MTDASSDTSLPNIAAVTSEPVTVLYDCDYHHVEVGEAKTNFQNNNIHHQLIPTQIEFSGEEVSINFSFRGGLDMLKFVRYNHFFSKK